MWTPRPTGSRGSADINDNGASARRQERARLRTNIGAPYRYDGERVGVGEVGYSSSDIEEDLQATLKKLRDKKTKLKTYKNNNKPTTPETEDREQRKAKRQRLAKKAELIKETLGSGKIVTDAIYFTKVSVLHIDGNYRPALDHIADQTPKVSDTRLEAHDEADEATFWHIVIGHMKKNTQKDS